MFVWINGLEKKKVVGEEKRPCNHRKAKYISELLSFFFCVETRLQIFFLYIFSFVCIREFDYYGFSIYEKNLRFTNLFLSLVKVKPILLQNNFKSYSRPGTIVQTIMLSIKNLRF